MVDADLHPADVVAHDEQDIGLGLWGLRDRLPTRNRHPEDHRKQTEPDSSGHMFAPSKMLNAETEGEFCVEANWTLAPLRRPKSEMGHPRHSRHPDAFGSLQERTEISLL